MSKLWFASILDLTSCGCLVLLCHRHFPPKKLDLPSRRCPSSFAPVPGTATRSSSLLGISGEGRNSRSGTSIVLWLLRELLAASMDMRCCFCRRSNELSARDTVVFSLAMDVVKPWCCQRMHVCGALFRCLSWHFCTVKCLFLDCEMLFLIE